MARINTQYDFDLALGIISGDVHGYDRSKFPQRVLRRKVWVAEWHLPGCISETFSPYVCKGDAIECALGMAAGEDGPPRGMKTALVRHGFFQHRTPLFGFVNTTVMQRTVGDLL